MSDDDGVVKIRVEQRHIDQAKRKDKTSCPIALAIREQYQDKCGAAHVYSVTAAILLAGKWQYYYLPYIASSFIRRFDSRDPVESFEFEMEDQI